MRAYIKYNISSHYILRWTHLHKYKCKAIINSDKPVYKENRCLLICFANDLHSNFSLSSQTFQSAKLFGRNIRKVKRYIIQEVLLLNFLPAH